MEMISVIRNDEELNEFLSDFCDVEVLPDYKEPEDEDGHLSYSMSGKTFATDNSGGEYILLQDGSVGYWGSEGQMGRISENLKEFFTFMVNCPYWKEYIAQGPYETIEDLREFASEVYEEYAENEQELWDEELSEVQKELADKLGVELYEDVAEKVLLKFYHSAHREPQLISTYTEDDGSKHSSSGSLFDTI